MVEEFGTSLSARDRIKDKLRQNFDGKIVRKDLTKKIKEGANVPTYVLEFLLGQYCSSDDEKIVAQGVQNVKRILADNYVRPDESEKVLSKLRQRGAMTIIDQVTVELNLRYDYSPILDLAVFLFLKSIQRSMIGCFVAAYGVLSSWSITMSLNPISYYQIENHENRMNL